MADDFKKSISYYSKRFISNNFVRKVAKLMHINKLGKKIYFEIFAPKDKKISYTIEEISAQFYVKNYTEMIYLTETIVGQGDESRVIRLLLKNIRQGDVVYDVGAFLGLHTIFFAKSVGENGKVIAFEPSFCSYQALKNNIELNSLDNVIPINIALGQTVGLGIIGGDDMSSYSLRELSKKDDSGHEVVIMPGDLAVVEKNLPQPNIVKIDVEGYEYLVIKGLENTLRKKFCRLVCCEVHPEFFTHGVTSKMVIDLLRDFGFTKVETLPRGEIFHIFCYKI